MRVDKLLWYLRLARSRTVAQAMAADGHMRVNGRRIERAHCKISAGDVLTVPAATGARVIEIIALPLRRGPAPEAQACYRELDGAPVDPIAAGIRNDA